MAPGGSGRVGSGRGPQKAQTRTDKANEEAAAIHRDELSETQAEMLRRNTELTEQIHALAEQLTALT
ncbi:MAG TPA: hypothetical protein VFR49_06750, partial [Solirubrobacteraceae bacterium]|nr:hypothetical protein [Solirubrobacteraceae bacterium]